MRKTLLVDDDEKIAIALAARLRSKGFAVSVAHEGMTAVALALKEQPDVIVMDINLPGGSGLTAADRLQNLAKTAGIPVIFITASKRPGLRTDAAEMGGVGFLEKPFDSEELLKIIDLSLSA